MSERAVLAIDLSTSRGQIAVLRGSDAVFESEFVSERSHNSMLFRPLGEALVAAGGSLSLLVVGAGPGSYTGVRIAVAAAQGIALSRNVPVVALPSLIAADAAEGLPAFGVIGDARRGRLYAARVKHGKIEGGLQILQPSEIDACLATSGGISWFTFDPAVVQGASADTGPGTKVTLSHPSARLLARNAIELTDAEIHALASGVIEPLYVSEAFITTPKRPWLAVESPS